jgi:hypothetical protein
MDKDEALKLALEALEGVVKNCWRDIPSWRLDEIKEQITTIKHALAAPVQEPVATNKIYVTREQLAELYPPPAAQPAPVQEPVGTYGEIFEPMLSLLRTGLQRDQQIYMEMKDKPLFTTPPAAQRPWVGLTDEEYFEIGQRHWVTSTKIELIHAEIEAKLKERNQ